MKILKFYIALACAVFCISGCGNQAADAENAKEMIYYPITDESVDYLSVEGIQLNPGTSIAMVAGNSENPFWDMVKEGALQAVADLNQEMGFSGKDKISFTFTAPKKENVIDQINIIDQFLDKAPDALCIAFTDASACKTQMQMAKNNGIKLIAFDTPDDNLMTEALVGTNNPQAAADAAEHLFAEIDYTGKVAVIVHNSLTKTGQDRKQAIVDELANHYNDKRIQFADIVYLAQEERSAEEILDELLEKCPDLSGIICTDLQTTEKVADYAKTLENSDLKIAGFDISEKILGYVENGVLIGTMAQDPYGMGYATVTTAARTIANLPRATVLYSGHQWADAQNLQAPEVQSLLNK